MWERSGRIEDASSLAREMHEGRRAGRGGGESKATVIARRAWKEQLRSGKAVRTGVTRRGFNAQRKTGSKVAEPGGPSGIEPARPQMRARVFYRWPARLDFRRRVRVQGNRPRASKLRASGAGAEQEQRRRCDQTRRSCRRLRGCADRVSAAHAREQWRLSL
jgi:hypothetical protein